MARAHCKRDASGSATNAGSEWIPIGFFFQVQPRAAARSESPRRQSRQPFSRRPGGNVKRALYVAISRFRSSEHNDEGARPFLLKGNP